jgi:DNA replication protein DnaC
VREGNSDPIYNDITERLRKRVNNNPPRPDTAADGERQRAIIRLANDLGPRYSPQRASLDQFEVYDKRQSEVLRRVRDLVNDVVPFVTKSRGLVFFGTVGTGKDHLLAAMLYAAAGAGITCRWLNGQDFYGAFRDRIDTGRADEDLFREFTAPAVLAMSDALPAAGDPSRFDVGNLYRLLDRRYRLMRPTWVTINSRSTKDADERLTEPVFDRLCDGGELIHCEWKSYRDPKL